MEMEKDLVELLSCPICFEIPRNEVFQCRKGHTLCGECCARFLDCPQCKVSFEREKIRNRVLESILDSMKFECFHKNSGCKGMFKRIDLGDHVDHCSFKLQKSDCQARIKASSQQHQETKSHSIMNICHAIGDSKCKFPVASWNLTTLLHLQEDHGVILREGPSLDILLTDFANLLEDSAWTPILLNLQGSDSSPLFLIRFSSVTTCANPFLSYACFLINDQAHAPSDYLVNFSIQGGTPGMPQLEWNLQTVGLLGTAGQAFLEASPFQLQVLFLKNHYAKDTSLLVHASITSNNHVSQKSENGFCESESGDITWTFPAPLRS